MRKNVFYLNLLVILLVMGVVSACNKDSDDDPQDTTPQEYVATDASFADFQSWQLAAQNQGPDPALGDAHSGNDSTVTRYIYFKDSQTSSGGKYPLGTIIVKESKNPDMSLHQLTAMVKRGNKFNPDHGDWEWFILAPDGKIALDGDGNPIRGADLMGGMCYGCHSTATTDYVFSK
jgi:hypothetical protein